MTECSACGSGTPAPSRDRDDCGAWPARERPRTSYALILGLCALVVAALMSGCSSGTPNKQGPAAKARQPVDQSQRLAAAKAAAASALADVAVCESAVKAGPSLGDLSQKTAHARDSVQAFSRSENGRLLPKVSAAIALAERDYFDSSTLWSADEKAAQASLTLARANVMRPSARRPYLALDDYRHPDRYESLWVKGGEDLGAARLVLRDATL